MSNSEINLIKKDVSSVRKISALEDKLRLIVWWSLGLLLAVGVAIGISYVSISAKTKSLEAKKIDLTRQINLQNIKEGILLSLKDRTAIAGKALDAAKPWGKLFTLLTTIADESNYTALSIEESGRVTTTMNLAGIDDAANVISNVMILAGEKSLRSPQLVSFALRDDTTVQMSLSFNPIF